MSLGTYIKDVRAEIKHVSWPTRRQSIVLTALVIILSLFVAAYSGALDFIFSRLIQVLFL